MEFDVLGYIAISMFFAIISLKRLLKKGGIKQIHSYNSKDLGNIDG
jgi:hypothetical protein